MSWHFFHSKCDFDSIKRNKILYYSSNSTFSQNIQQNDNTAYVNYNEDSDDDNLPPDRSWKLWRCSDGIDCGGGNNADDNDSDDYCPTSIFGLCVGKFVMGSTSFTDTVFSTLIGSIQMT